MAEFVTSNLDQLFGPSLLDTPTLPGEINWSQVAVITGIIVVAVGITGIVVYNISQRNQQQFMTEMRETKKPANQNPKSKDEEIARQVFLANRIKNSKPKSTSHAF